MLGKINFQMILKLLMEKKNETGEALIHTKKQAEGEVVSIANNAKVYSKPYAGIGEHSDITEAVIEELNKLAAYPR